VLFESARCRILAHVRGTLISRTRPDKKCNIYLLSECISVSKIRTVAGKSQLLSYTIRLSSTKQRAEAGTIRADIIDGGPSEFGLWGRTNGAQTVVGEEYETNINGLYSLRKDQQWRLSDLSQNINLLVGRTLQANRGRSMLSSGWLATGAATKFESVTITRF
jgi:hypothetical protein